MNSPGLSQARAARGPLGPLRDCAIVCCARLREAARYLREAARAHLRDSCAIVALAQYNAGHMAGRLASAASPIIETKPAAMQAPDPTRLGQP
jgi:hypothetical protein